MMDSLSWRLAWQQSRRSLLSPEWRALLAALLIAISLTTMLTTFGDRLQQSIGLRSAELMGSDLTLSSGRPLPETPLTGTEIESTDVWQFPSMAEAGENMLLVSLRAINAPYPLRGELVTSPAATTVIPEPGKAWAEAQVLERLELKVGDQIQIGYSTLTIDRQLDSSPDRGTGFRSFSPGVIMRADELEATGVIAPGSRVQYRRLFKGPSEQITTLENQLRSQLAENQRLYVAGGEQPVSGRALNNASRFLQLSMLFALLLGALTITLSLRRYTAAQHTRAALLLNMGLTGKQLLQIYAQQLLFAWLLCGAIGFIIGIGLQNLLTAMLSDLLPSPVPGTSFGALLAGPLVGLMLLLITGVPSFIRLSRVSVMQLIRASDLPASRTSNLLQWAGGLIMVLMLSLAMDNITEALTMLAALAVVAWVAGWGAQWLLHRIVGLISHKLRLGALLRLRLRQQRHWHRLQMSVMTLLLTLLATLGLTRGDLLQSWQTQLPENTPNQFLINIQPWQVEPVAQYLQSHQLESPLYPMIRGRISVVKGIEVEQYPHQHNALRRELNLTWSSELPQDNKLVSGEWWQAEQQGPQISIEQSLAEGLNVQLGDRLEFNIGGVPVGATIASIRSLKWDNFKPNFYVIFSPDSLTNLPATYITSYYLSPEQRHISTTLLKQQPTLTLIDIEQWLQQAQSVIDKLIDSSTLIFVLTLLAGLLLLAATLMQEIERRRYQNALLQTLGATPQQSRQLDLLEFTLLGVTCGLFAAVATEGILALLHHQILKIEAVWHPASWVLLPVVSAGLFSGIGYLLRPVLTQEGCYRLLKQGG